jgi:hypothetical protein
MGTSGRITGVRARLTADFEFARQATLTDVLLIGLYPFHNQSQAIGRCEARAGSRESGAEEGKHAVAGDVGEGGKFEGVVAAGEFDGLRMGTVTAE